MRVRRRVKRKEVQPDNAQFASVFTAEVAVVSDSLRGCPMVRGWQVKTFSVLQVVGTIRVSEPNNDLFFS
jgi:hypothetical protein